MVKLPLRNKNLINLERVETNKSVKISNLIYLTKPDFIDFYRQSKVELKLEIMIKENLNICLGFIIVSRSVVSKKITKLLLLFYNG